MVMASFACKHHAGHSCNLGLCRIERLIDSQAFLDCMFIPGTVGAGALHE